MKKSESLKSYQFNEWQALITHSVFSSYLLMKHIPSPIMGWLLNFNPKWKDFAVGNFFYWANIAHQLYLSTSNSCETNFTKWKLLKSKNPCGFVTQTFKVGITNPRGFFYLSNFYLVKLVSLPLLLLIEKIQNSTTSSKVKLQAHYCRHKCLQTLQK